MIHAAHQKLIQSPYRIHFQIIKREGKSPLTETRSRHVEDEKPVSDPVKQSCSESFIMKDSDPLVIRVMENSILRILM